ncbi:MAG TPA: DUF72 domain-containing protein [Chthoniobacterales bacterium]
MLDLFAVFDRDRMAARLKALAQAQIFIGTSSWKYEGWLGMLYDRANYENRSRFSKARFEQECLYEYSQYFPSVCVDAGYYRFPEERYLEKLVGQVPSSFKFTWKVTDEITLRRFPKLPRFGDRKGQLNQNFLNAELCYNSFLRLLEPYREQIGSLVFEFAEFRPGDFNGEDDFLVQLESFLQALPRGWPYSVEIRTEKFLTAGYLELLAKHGVAHVLSQWSYMPEVSEQLKHPGIFTADFQVARFLLRRGRPYERAVQIFSPYAETREVNEDARSTARRLIFDLRPEEVKPLFLYVNNRLEGNALNTIWSVIHGD